MSATLLVLTGPNLNLLGVREPHIYGTTTLDEVIEGIRGRAEPAGVTVEHLQSNHEGDLVDAIQGARDRCEAIIINPGAFTHYSWAIQDALSSYEGIVVEVHISNPNARESWRHTSVVSPVATGTIMGFGVQGYELALDAVLSRLRPG